MTEAKMSYLRGFDANNDYRVPGAFRGAANPGFSVSAIFRDRFPTSVPVVGQTQQSKVVCGNLVLAGGLYSGWNIEVFTQTVPGPSMAINFNYADALGAKQTLQYNFPDGIVSAQRTLVPQIFFGLTMTQGKLNDAAILALNGTILSVVANGLGGYTPPGSDVPFIVGGSTVPTMGPASTIGFAGMSFADQVSANPQSLNSYYEVAQLVSDQWEDIIADEDMRDADLSLIGNLFSTRRGLPDAQNGQEPTWTATKGGVILTRRGSTALQVEAGKPRYFVGGMVAPTTGAAALAYASFYTEPVADLPPIAIDAAVPIGNNGPAAGGIVHDGANDGRFILPVAGDYDISWMVSIDEAAQLALFLEDPFPGAFVFQPQTLSGRATGTDQVVNRVLIHTTAPNARIELRNHSSSAGNITMTPNPGGTSAGTTQLVIVRLA